MLSQLLSGRKACHGREKLEVIEVTKTSTGERSWRLSAYRYRKVRIEDLRTSVGGHDSDSSGRTEDIQSLKS